MNHRLLLWLPEHDSQPVHWQLIHQPAGDNPQVIHRGHWPTVTAFIDGARQTAVDGTPLTTVTALVLLPPTLVTLHALDLPGRITPAVERSLPWRLEDELIDDVDNLHIALLDHQDNRVQLAVTSQLNMRRWQQWLGDAGINANCWLPAALLLPVQDGQAYRLQLNDQLLVRYGPWQVVAGDISWQETLLATLQQANPELALTDLGTLDQLHDLSSLPSGSPANLLQGAWRITSPLRQRWLRWRMTAVLALVFVGLFLANSLSTTWRLEQQTAQQQQAARQVYTDLFPNERVVVLKTQMAQKLAELQPTQDDGPGLLPLLATLAPVWQTFPQLRADAMSYDGEQLNIQARAADFEVFNRLRTQLEQLEPLSVAIEALERDGNQVTGSLVIAEKDVL